MTLRRSQHVDGYPRQYMEALRSSVRAAVIAMSITGCLAVGTGLATVYGQMPPVFAATAIALFLLFGVLGGLTALYDTWRYVRIIPYFRREVGEIDTYLAGEALARWLTHLDAAATSNGIQPLSTFGFDDDLRGEPLTWHSAADGLQAVTALRRTITSERDHWSNADSIIEDLQKMEHALSRAAEQDISFCLLVLHGNATSGHEWSIRQGTAF